MYWVWRDKMVSNSLSGISSVQVDLTEIEIDFLTALLYDWRKKDIHERIKPAGRPQCIYKLGRAKDQIMAVKPKFVIRRNFHYWNEASGSWQYDLENATKYDTQANARNILIPVSELADPYNIDVIEIPENQNE
jgi:hypothetical protein